MFHFPVENPLSIQRASISALVSKYIRTNSDVLCVKLDSDCKVCVVKCIILVILLLSEGPQDHPCIWWFPGRCHWTPWPVVVLTVMIYYRERSRDQTCRGEGTWGKIWETPGSRPQARVLSRESRHPSTMRWGSACEVWSLQGKLLRDSASTVLMQGWSCRHPLLACAQIPDSQRESAFSINHIVHIKV